MLRKTYISNLFVWKSLKSMQMITNHENLINASKSIPSKKIEPNLRNPIDICKLIKIYSNARKSLKQIHMILFF